MGTKRCSTARLYAFGVMLFLAASIQHSKPQTTDGYNFIDDKDDFSWDLLKQLDQKKNVVISPLSVKIALGVVQEATRDENILDEISNALIDPYETRSYSFRACGENAALLAKNDTILRNRIYTNSAIQPSYDYVDIILQHYNVDVLSLNFSIAPLATENINNWCKNVSMGSLTDTMIVKETDLSQSDILFVSVNSFKPKLETKFYINQNYFYETPQKQIKVSYMEQTNNFFFFNSKSLDAKMLRLPLMQRLTITILLPNALAGVEELLENLGNEQIKRMQWMMEEQRVKVALPAFSFNSNLGLKQILTSLGVGTIFTKNADLTKLIPSSTGQISNIYQYSSIDINVEETGKFVPSEGNCTEFIVNRPFIFFIEEEIFGNIIFTGKVFNPTTIVIKDLK